MSQLNSTSDLELLCNQIVNRIAYAPGCETGLWVVIYGFAERHGDLVGGMATFAHLDRPSEALHAIIVLAPELFEYTAHSPVLCAPREVIENYPENVEDAELCKTSWLRQPS